MAGIPDWLYYSSIVIIMLISLLIVEFSGKSTPLSGPRIDLARMPFVRLFFKSRKVQLSIQLTVVALFLLIIMAGFYGNQHPGRNIAPTLTWNIWWIGLIFIILFFGKMWCYACPWDALTNWLTRLSFLKVTKERINLGWKWPPWLKNIYLATALFVFLTWLELGFQVTLSPEATATLGLTMFGLVFVPGLLFDKKSFCRYGCLIGRVSGLYAMFSPVEIRNRSLEVCRNCATADCLKGNESGYPCPTGQYLKTMQTNTYCIMCAECFRSCPHDNVAFNLRPFAADLTTAPKPRKDEAYLALVLFALTVFHGLTMTPLWKTFLQTSRSEFGLNQMGAFSLGMAGALVIPGALYAVFVRLSRFLSGDAAVTARQLFIQYAYGLVPIALFYHIAHNVEHFFMESQKLVALISDPFGYGWDLFGTAALRPEALLSLETIWYFQVALVIIGHVFGIAISHRLAYRLFKNRAAALRSQVPMIALMVLFSVLSLWLIAQPMEMRTSF